MSTALRDLLREALRFAVWAAGEGISPQEPSVGEPEEFLFAYSTQTGDEDWETLPDRIADALLAEGEKGDE